MRYCGYAASGWTWLNTQIITQALDHKGYGPLRSQLISCLCIATLPMKRGLKERIEIWDRAWLLRFWCVYWYAVLLPYCCHGNILRSVRANGLEADVIADTWCSTTRFTNISCCLILLRELYVLLCILYNKTVWTCEREGKQEDAD
jgi:hypothetical protein